MQTEQDIPASVLVRVYLLGPLEIWKRDPSGTWKVVTKDKWKNSKPARSVFKRLLVQPGRRLARSTIEDDVWSGSDNFELVAKSAYNAISLIRGVVSKPLVTCWEAAYEIAGQTLVWTDLDECSVLLKEAEDRGHTSIQAVSLLEKAVTLLERGELLEGEYGQWCYAFRKRAEDMLRQARLWLAESYEAEGKWWKASEQYRALCTVLPPDEEALQRWIAMLYQQGKIQEALKCYRDMKAFVEMQEFTLSSHLDALAQRLEEQAETAAHAVDSFLIPEKVVSLWQPDPAYPETATRFTAWGALLQEKGEETAHQEIVYDALEVEIMAMALCWKQSSGPIIVLQQLTYETIRKHDAMHRHHPNYNAGITRRQALQAIAFLPIQTYGLTHLATEQKTLPPSEEALPLCAAGLTSCVELRKYEPEGIQAIQKILVSYLPTLEKLVRQSSPSQPTAASLAAQGYLLMSVLASHYGKLDQIEAASRMARFYGQLAHDPNLEVAALIRLATKFDFERRDVASLETYQEALALPGFSIVSPLLQGRVYAGLAGTHAYCQQVSPALAFLSQARDTYPVDATSDPAYTIALSSDIGASLSLWEGLTLKHTGHYPEAIGAFSRFGSLTPLPGTLEASRAEYLNYTASVAIKQRELDTASFYLDAAEEITWTIQHEQRQAEVRDNFRDMQLLWPHESRVKALQEKLYARQN